MPQFCAASRCVTPRLTSSIADVIFCLRTVFILNLVCFGEELKEWWWWKWGGWSRRNGGNCDRQSGRSVVGSRLLNPPCNWRMPTERTRADRLRASQNFLSHCQSPVSISASFTQISHPNRRHNPDTSQNTKPSSTASSASSPSPAFYLCSSTFTSSSVATGGELEIGAHVPVSSAGLDSHISV